MLRCVKISIFWIQVEITITRRGQGGTRVPPTSIDTRSPTIRMHLARNTNTIRKTKQVHHSRERKEHNKSMAPNIAEEPRFHRVPKQDYLMATYIYRISRLNFLLTLRSDGWGETQEYDLPIHPGAHQIDSNSLL